MMEEYLKEGTDYEDYTENYMVEKKPCCKDKGQEGKSGCGCKSGGILIKK